ncbi:MAG: hypothetical protein ACTTKO_03215 [Candidatus Limimorpha sp.]
MENEGTNKGENHNEYPLFCDGNVLTSNDLNKSFEFLHTQVKFTRSLLFGQGIVNGLTYYFDGSDKGEIVIRPGVAITSMGSVIMIEKEQRYGFCVPYEKAIQNREIQETEMPGVQYVLQTKQDGGGVEINKEFEDKGIGDYLLGLYMIHKVKKEKYCTDQSCTITGSKVEMEVVPFLTQKEKKEDGHETKHDEDPLDNKLKPIDELQIPVDYGIANYAVLPVFLRRVTDRFYNRMEAILQSLEKIGDISELLSPLARPSFEEAYKRLGDGINELKGLQFDNRRIATYLSFADDVVDAVSEFIAFYNRFLSKYRIVASKRLDEAVVLGGFGEELTANRYSLQETYQDFDRNKDERILCRLFHRIMLLMDCFSPEQSLDGENVDFLPASVNDKLGERIVPFYYKGDGIKELLEFWDAHNEYHIDNKLLLFEQNKSTGLNRDKNDSLFAKAFRKADLFRLFGYDAVGVDGLRKRLQLEIDKYNLPVSLLQHDIDGDEISFSLENYTNVPPQSQETINVKELADLVVDYKINSQSTDGLPIIGSKDKKNAHDTLVKVLRAYNSPNNIVLASRMLDGLERSSLMEEIRQSIYLIVKEKEQLPAWIKRLLEFVLMAMLCSNDNSRFVPSRMPGVDYLGGVERKDILLLVSYKNNVLACLNMPYNCLIINRDKYKEQMAHYAIMQGEDYIPGFYPHENIVVHDEFEEESNGVGFDLFMIEYGTNKEHTAKYLREGRKITFRKAMEMVNNLPVFIFNETTREEALKVCFVLNERLKAHLLIVPAGGAKTDANNKLIGFSVAKFDVKVTLFEEQPEEAADKLNIITGFENIEVPDQISSPRTLWIRNLKAKSFLDKLQELKKIDAVFEMVLIKNDD